MTEPDLSGVHPLRLAEIRKRIAVAEEFLRLQKPDAETRARYAAMLDMSRRYFEDVVAAWRSTGDVSVLGASTGGKRGRKPSRTGLPPGVRQAVADAIEEVGSDASLRTLNEAVASICAERALTPPSRSSVWNLQMAARGIGGSSKLPPSIVEGNVVARLPVSLPTGFALPVIRLRVSAPEGLIMSHTVSFMGSGDAVPDFSAAQGTVATIDTEAFASGAETTGRVLAALLGREVGGLDIVYNPRLALPAVRLLRSRRDAPVKAGQAIRLIFEAVARHNERRQVRRDTDSLV